MLDDFASARRGADQKVRNNPSESSPCKRFRQDSIGAVFESSEPIASVLIEGHPYEQEGRRLLTGNILPDFTVFMTSFQDHDIEAMSLQFS